MNKKIITLGIIGLGLAMVLPVKGFSFPSFHLLVSGQVELKRFGSTIFQKTQAPIKLNHQDLLRFPQPQKTRILCFGHKLSAPLAQEQIVVKDVCDSKPKIKVNNSIVPRPRHPKPTDPTIPYIISPRKTALLTNRPTLQWNAVAGANSYEVKLLGPGVNWKIKTDQTSIVYSGEDSLQPDARYTLIVETDNKKSSKSDLSRSDGLSFFVLSENKIKEVNQGIEDLENKPLTPEMKALAIAYFYQAEDLKVEAIEVLEELSKQETVEPEVYRTLGELYQEISLNSWAKEEYKKAWKLIKNQPNEWEKQALIQRGLGETYWGQGNTEKALEWLELAKSNYDRLELQEKSKEIEERLQKIITGN